MGRLSLIDTYKYIVPDTMQEIISATIAGLIGLALIIGLMAIA